MRTPETKKNIGSPLDIQTRRQSNTATSKDDSL